MEAIKSDHAALVQACMSATEYKRAVAETIQEYSLATSSARAAQPVVKARRSYKGACSMRGQDVFNL